MDEEPTAMQSMRFSTKLSAAIRLCRWFGIVYGNMRPMQGLARSSGCASAQCSQRRCDFAVGLAYCIVASTIPRGACRSVVEEISSDGGLSGIVALPLIGRTTH